MFNLETPNEVSEKNLSET